MASSPLERAIAKLTSDVAAIQRQFNQLWARKSAVIAPQGNGHVEAQLTQDLTSGGDATADIWVYDPGDDSWEQTDKEVTIRDHPFRPLIPTGKLLPENTFVAAVRVKGSLYLLDHASCEALEDDD